MAFPDYFNKNIQSAALLLQGIDGEAFKAVLERELVCIAFDDSAATSFEGRRALDLAVRCFARLYPAITFFPSGPTAKRLATTLEALARAVNKNIDIPNDIDTVTQCLVVGAKRPKFARGVKPFTVYVGSDNWLARISTKAPIRCGRSKNPFGAGGAACLGVANLFRATFATYLPGAKLDEEVVFSMLLFTAVTEGSPNPPLKKVNLGEVHLIGAGAIGSGFLWALAGPAAEGELHVVDPQTVELMNLQRYIMTEEVDVGRSKVELAKAWLEESGIEVKAHAATWENYISERKDWHFERVAVAVDTVDARIKIQASLPRRVHNSWTQSGEAGVSRHGFLGDEACLACLYMPDKKAPNYDQLIAEALGLPQHDAQLVDIRRRLDLRVPTERGFLELVATARNVAIDRLLPFEGKPLESVYLDAVCGGAVMELANPKVTKRIEVPMAFQSVFAGVLMAADVVAEVANLRDRLPTITQISLLTKIRELPSSGQAKAQDGKCICVDQDFIEAYKAKYKSEDVVAH